MIARLLYSLIYAYILVALIGIPDLAVAAVKCADTIDSSTSYKYSDALVSFMYNKDTNKTYALALSAVTGSTSLPDAYFAFAPGITREYTFGEDTGSIKKQLTTTTKYGAAKPLTINNAATYEYIKKYYGDKLQAATSSSGTLLNVWKEFGTGSPFTTIYGQALSYANWNSTPDTSATQPYAVAMGNDGKWVPVTEGQKLSQVVEFDGRLDCAYEEPPAIAGTPDPEVDSGVIGDTDSADKKSVCSADLNANGLIETGEVGYCQSTPQGVLCPIGAANCNVSPGSCPTGFTNSAARNRCEQVPACSNGVYNPATNSCEAANCTYSCPNGGTLSGTNCVVSSSSAATASAVVFDEPLGVLVLGNNYIRLGMGTGTCLEKGEICQWVQTVRCGDDGCSPLYDSETGQPVMEYQCTWGCTKSFTAYLAKQPFFGSLSVGSNDYHHIYRNTYPGWITRYISSTYNPAIGATVPIYYAYVDGAGAGGHLMQTGGDGGLLGYASTGGSATSYTCPSGSTLNGTNCVTTSTYAATKTCSYPATCTNSCPSGGTLSGSTCTVNGSYPSLVGGNFSRPLYWEAGYMNYLWFQARGPYAGMASSSDNIPNVKKLPVITVRGWLQVQNLVDEWAGWEATDIELYGCSQKNSVCDLGPFKYSVGGYAPSYYWLSSKSGAVTYCQNGDVLSGTTCNTSSTYTATTTCGCPQGGTLSGAICILDNNAVGGTGPCTNANLDGENDVCWVPYDMACPFGSQYTCMQNPLVPGSPYQCSPYTCSTPAAATNASVTQDPSAYEDDGPRDENGNCLGTIMIFNGKPGRCRSPGWDVGMINNCCESDDTLPESMGSSLSIANSIREIYGMAQAAYEAKTAYELAMKVKDGIATAAEVAKAAQQSSQVAAGTASSGVTAGVKGAAEGSSMSSSMATAAVDAGKGLVAAGAVYAAGAAAKALGGDQDTQMGAQIAMTYVMLMTGMLSGPQAVIGIVVIVVMRVLMGSGCDQNDIMTSMYNKSRRCHQIGGYCEKHWFSGCVQGATGFCCFNSRLARIIHEQGRPQLKVFGPDGGWGSPNAPNCRGFTPDEFQSLDFNRIDLSEYYEDVTKDLAGKVNASQQLITNTVIYKTNLAGGETTLPAQ